jgi:hypothetical protein
MRLPDELRHPSGGESIDRTAQEAVRLAHRALDRFPDLVRRHKFLAGGAAFSSALVALAGVAISRRMGNGESGDEAVERVTEQELAGLDKIVAIGGEVDVSEQVPSNGAQPEPGQVETVQGGVEARPLDDDGSGNGDAGARRSA